MPSEILPVSRPETTYFCSGCYTSHAGPSAHPSPLVLNDCLGQKQRVGKQVPVEVASVDEVLMGLEHFRTSLVISLSSQTGSAC